MRLPRNSSRSAGGYHQSRLSGQVSGRGTAGQCQSQVHVAVSHEICNWQKLFSRPSHTCARVVGCERTSVTRSFPRPFGGTRIEVSHERSEEHTSELQSLAYLVC